MNRKPFVNDEYYHIYNRGTDRRYIFNDVADYRRFVLALTEFNTKDPVLLRARKNAVEVEPRQRIPLVEIVSWALLPNHYHLVIKQLEDGGVAKFLQKLITGYTMYFNKRYERTGVLFQGRTKSVHIDNDAYLLQVCRYIHLNPLDLFVSGWKEKGITWEEAKPFLYSYPWTNLKEFKQENKNNEIILDQLGPKGEYEKFLVDWTKKEFICYKDYVLED